MDDERDERQQLRQKVKKLQEQIVERARNYMQSSRSRKKTSLNSQRSISLSEQEIQTQHTLPAVQNKTAVSIINGVEKEEINRWYDQFVREVQACEGTLLERGGEKQEWINNISVLGKVVVEIVGKIVQGNDGTDQKQIIGELMLLQKSYIDTISSMSTRPAKTTAIVPAKQPSQDIQLKLKQLQIRCQFITKALNQSQQENYQLRLQIQDSNTKLRNFMDKIDDNSTKAQKYSNTISQMKIKIEQLEVMKKEYLRAYSKIKEEKEQLEMKYLDLQEQVKNMAKDRQEGWQPYENIQVAQQPHNEVDTRLKTIIQHSEDQLIQQVIRKTGTENSIHVIKQIIEHGLMETNRSTSEKWIKSALIKLEHLEHSQIEEQEKVVSSQNLIESGIHERYRALVAGIGKGVARQKKIMQDGFNEVMNKIIQYGNITQKKNEEEKENRIDRAELLPKKAKQEIQEKDRDIYSLTQILEQEKRQEKTMDTATYDLVTKLNEAHVRYADLKKKYDTLLAKKDQFQQYTCLKLAKPHAEFNKFMGKLLKFQLKSLQSRFTEEFFDKLAHKVFQTLCNLPTGNHNQVYFVPTNQQQLQDALEFIYKFSIEFDKYQEAKLKQFKSEAQSLTKILEEIAIANQVPAEMVIESMHHNLDEDNSVSGGYVKSLIKKLSSNQKLERKSKSMEESTDKVKEDNTSNTYLFSKSSH